MKKIRKKKKRYVFILIFFILIVFSYYLFIVLPIIKTYSTIQTRSLTEKAVNMAVSNVINRTISYDSLIDIQYSKIGEISSFTANQYEINSITREIIKETQIQMRNLGQDGLNINIGTFTGVPFLIGYGPYINLKLVPIGVVNSNFDSVFDSVGINMTKHSLFLYINIHVSIALPIQAYDIYTTNQVLLSESIIVGKVPEVYLNGGSIGKALNLIP